MKFSYTGGPYIEYRGYCFANGKPCEVRDQATIGLLLARTDFRKAEDEEKQRQETAQEVLVQREIRRPVLHARRGK